MLAAHLRRHLVHERALLADGAHELGDEIHLLLAQHESGDEFEAEQSRIVPEIADAASENCARIAQE